MRDEVHCQNWLRCPSSVKTLVKTLYMEHGMQILREVNNLNSDQTWENW